jgi:NADH-quinone oxidoreductase subunit J
MHAVFFYYFAAVTIVSGFFTIAFRSPVHCGLALVTMLLHIAGFFVLLNAEFLAAVQVIVYAGAILVLYLFVIMLLNLKTEERIFHRRALVVSLLIFGIVGQMALFVLRSPYAGVPGDATAARVLGVGQTRALGITMFSDYLLPFELIGIFLLAAIIGAIVLAKTPAMQERRAQRPGDGPPLSDGSVNGEARPLPSSEVGVGGGATGEHGHP